MKKFKLVIILLMVLLLTISILLFVKVDKKNNKLQLKITIARIIEREYNLIKENELNNVDEQITNPELIIVNNESEEQISNNIEINEIDNQNEKIVNCPEKTTESDDTVKNKVLTLNNKANSISEIYNNVIRINYGESVQGRPLEAYLIKGNGNNSKTAFLEFEVHGYEDAYEKDGKILVDLGNDLVEYYAKNLDELGDYQMLIIPSANPDGVIEGKNNKRVTESNAFGRCTANGIDINRDFKIGEFKAIESQNLKKLMDEYKMNIHIDFHGWENSGIGSQIIVEAFLNELGLTYNKSNRYGSGQGYIIEYTKNTYNAEAAIIELKNTKSVKLIQVVNALNKVIQEI